MLTACKRLSDTIAEQTRSDRRTDRRRLVELAVWGSKKPHMEGGEKKKFAVKAPVYWWMRCSFKTSAASARTQYFQLRTDVTQQLFLQWKDTRNQSYLRVTNRQSCDQTRLKSLPFVLHIALQTEEVGCRWQSPDEKEAKRGKKNITSAASLALNAVFLKSPARSGSPRRRCGHFNPIYPLSTPL